MPHSLTERPWALIALLASLQAFAPLSIDMYLPALTTIADEFATSTSEVQRTISTFLFGLFIGMLIYGPLSDCYGRRRLLIGGICLYVLATVACLLTADANQLMIARLFQALGGAAASVLGRALVRDLFPPLEAPRILSWMHLVTMVATLIAPLVGSLLLTVVGWRSIFALLVLFSSVVLILVVLRIPNTGRNAEHTPWRVFRTYGYLLRQPVAVGYLLCQSLTFAGLFAYITGSPFVFMDVFGASSSHYALLFSSNVAGIIVCVLANAYWVNRQGVQRMLRMATLGTSGAGLTLVIAALMAPDAFWLIYAACFVHIATTGVIGVNCTGRLLQLYPKTAGAASGLGVSLQFGMGAVMSALITQMHNGTPLPLMLCVGIPGLMAFLALRIALRHDTQAKKI